MTFECTDVLSVFCVKSFVRSLIRSKAYREDENNRSDECPYKAVLNSHPAATVTQQSTTYCHRATISERTYVQIN